MEDFHTNNYKLQDQENDTLNIREEIEKYAIHWKWFLLAVILALSGAFLYLRYSTQQYSASATIMIKDNQKSGISQELSAIADLGIVGTGSVNNTDNEIEIIKSRKIVGNVVDSLKLNISYIIEGRVKKSELYEKIPIRLVLLDSLNTDSKFDTIFSFSEINKSKFRLENLYGTNLGEFRYNQLIGAKPPFFKILKEDIKSESKNIYLSIQPKPETVDNYLDRINITTVSKNSSVLRLSINDPIVQRAEDFLDELIKQYNIDAINDKSEVSQKTRDFIVERIEKIGQDLSKIQDSVKKFKDKNNISGLSIEGELALGNASKNNEKIIAVTTELILAKGIYESLNKEDNNDDQTLPPNLGFKDISISESIIIYNELVSKKNILSLSAGKKNPLLVQYKKEISVQRNNLLKSIKNLVNSLNEELKQLNNAASIVNSRVSSIPALERGFIDIARQQEIISGLFSYLLKKKEETDISLAVTVANAKIIDKAYSSGIPVSPKKKIIYLAALLLGLIIPFIIIYIRNLLDTKVHSKKDLESFLSIPFLGDIPSSESKEKIIVGNNARSSGSEAFRLIRTNLDFMMASKTGSKKFIFITSTTSGEGKSFISINLAATLALAGKKVLLIGMDIRAPKVTEYLGLESKKGVTNYITSNTLSLEDLKFTIPEAKGLDIISSGAIPPNPAELLSSKSIEDLFLEIKNNENYDYIVVDTAPVNLVTDTLLISKYADMFLYVIRANYLDKRLLVVPEELYKNKRLPNMSIVLNDTDPKRTYGYGYGGYGYGYLSEEEKPWYKKIFTKS